MTSDPLQFYRALSYPVPTPEEWFLYDKKSLKSSHKHHYASRPRVNNITKNIVDYINQHTSLYQSIPFVTHIYLCNSVTFNAPTSESDIDITFVTQEGRLWTARLYSAILFRIKGVKRNKTHHAQRFCLTFYLTKNHCNLYPIKRPHTDQYLTYWIAHLVPLRVKDGENPDHILHENNRIYAQLQNFPHYLPVQLDTQWPQNTDDRKKVIIEKILSGRAGDIIERVIKTIRLPIIRHKNKKHKKNHGIIASDSMLKFHHDKRDIIHDAIKITTKK